MADRELPPRACPVCDAVAPEVLFRQSFETLEGLSALGGYDVVTCQACGFAYADRIPTQDVFDRYYRSAEARGELGSGLGLAIVKQAVETLGERSRPNTPKAEER